MLSKKIDRLLSGMKILAEERKSCVEVQHSRSDIVIVCKKEQICFLIEIAVFEDHNMLEKHSEIQLIK